MSSQKNHNIHQIKDQTDLNYALAIRAIVFIDEQNCPFDEEFDEYDRLDSEEVIHYIVKQDNKPVATARIIFPKVHQAKIGRIAVLKTFRGKGLGTYFIEQMLHTLKTDGYTHISINAQEHLQSFYEQFGFVQNSEAFDEAGIPHIQMLLQTHV